MNLPRETPSIRKDLETLHETIGACSRCFPKGGNCPVSGRGLAGRGGLFLIGQAPGIKEPAAQMNFAWTAGRRLFKWLGTIGMTEPRIRANGYITAVTKCYPGKNKGGTGDRKPSRWEVENCAPYLDQALDLLKPRVLVLIGSLAIERILGIKQMGETIGLEYERDLPGGRAYVIPIPHPSGASPWVNMAQNKKKLHKSLALIKRRLQREKLYSLYTEPRS